MRAVRGSDCLIGQSIVGIVQPANVGHEAGIGVLEGVRSQANIRARSHHLCKLLCKTQYKPLIFQRKEVQPPLYQHYEENVTNGKKLKSLHFYREFCASGLAQSVLHRAPRTEPANSRLVSNTLPISSHLSSGTNQTHV